jgi:MFS transporter, FHS family, L-fucose permease
MSGPKHPTLNRGSLLPFCLLTLCFALWGAANNMTDLLVGVFKEVKGMSAFQASLIQFAFYGAYFLMPIPAAILLSRYSYKVATVAGLAIYALGAFLCFPASQADSFNLFLVAFLTFAGGCALLETSAAPAVLAMGPEETAVQRINFAQALNPVGSVLGITLGKLVILRNLTPPATKDEMASRLVAMGVKAESLGVDVAKLKPEEIGSATLTAYTRQLGDVAGALKGQQPEHQVKDLVGHIADWDATSHLPAEGQEELAGLSLDILSSQTNDLWQVVVAYAAVGLVALATGVAIFCTRFPQSGRRLSEAPASGHVRIHTSIRRLARNRNYLAAVVAQFFLVGAQIGVWTFAVPYVLAQNLGTVTFFGNAMDFNRQNDAWWFYAASLGLFLMSRWITTLLMSRFDPARMMGLLAAVATGLALVSVLGSGWLGCVALVLISGCMALMFPTIYGLGLSGVGEDRKVGGSGIIMAIVGGALLVPMQGLLVDEYGVNTSYALPLFCFIVVFLYCFVAQRREQELGILNETRAEG